MARRSTRTRKRLQRWSRTGKPRPFMETIWRRNAAYVLRAGDGEYPTNRDYVGHSMKITCTFDQPTNAISMRTLERSPAS